MRKLIPLLILLLSLSGLAKEQHQFKVHHTEAEWKKLLTPEQYAILREKGTERAGTSSCAFLHDDGEYRCVGCGNLLFSSAAKFDSGTGWPSFGIPRKGSVITQVDNSYGMKRMEVLCSQCGGHLGHVFPDGPPPTGLRYCINGKVLKFIPIAKIESKAK